MSAFHLPILPDIRWDRAGELAGLLLLFTCGGAMLGSVGWGVACGLGGGFAWALAMNAGDADRELEEMEEEWP